MFSLKEFARSNYSDIISNLCGMEVDNTPCEILEMPEENVPKKSTITRLLAEEVKKEKRKSRVKVAGKGRTRTCSAIRKSAIEMFYELGYDEVGKEMTDKFIAMLKGTGKDKDPAETEKEVSRILAKAKQLTASLVVPGFRYRYDPDGEPAA